MYEINTYNLKLYLLVLSIIFILTNGLPVHIFNNKNSDIDNKNSDIDNKNSDIDNKNSDIDNKNNNNLSSNNYYYMINATVIQNTIKYNINTYYFSGSVILTYKKNINTYTYCKLDIDIKEQKRSNGIYNLIHKYYNLSRNNIQLYCNNILCINKVYIYDSKIENDDKYEEKICNILSNKQLNDEF